MASKQGYNAEPKNYIDKRIEVRLNGNRTITGRLRGYDPFLNLVLEECFQVVEDTKTKKKNKIELGTIMIRGNSIILWECLDKIQNKY